MATPGPTDPTTPSKPNGPPDTVKNITATSGPSRSRAGRGAVPSGMPVRVLSGAPDDRRVVALERHHVHHPAEDAGEELAADGVARPRRSDRRLGTEHR